MIWNLETGSLVDRFRNTSRRFPVVNDEDDEEEYIDPREELACDGVILDMEYCEKRLNIIFIRLFHCCSRKARQIIL